MKITLPAFISPATTRIHVGIRIYNNLETFSNEFFND